MRKQLREQESPGKKEALNKRKRIVAKKSWDQELPEKKEARNKGMRNAARTSREQESPEKTEAQNMGKRNAARTSREQESPEKKKSKNKQKRTAQKISQEHDPPEKIAIRKKKNAESHRKKRSRTSPEEKEADMSTVIKKAMKEAKKYLHRTMDEKNPSRHKAYVCIICDCFIHGTDSLCKLTSKEIRDHKQRLGVKSYEQYYRTRLHPELKEQYRVKGLPDILLSPRSRKYKNGYVTCSTCFSGMRPSMKNKKNPPKYSIANGFVIGSFPEKITITDTDGNEQSVDINAEEDVSDVLRALLAPVRPYGYIFAYSGGAHQSLRGHYQFFEMDQSRIGGAMNHMSQMGMGENIYSMICGRVTPAQRDIVRYRSELNTALYRTLQSWFIQKSGHPGYQNLPNQNDFPKPIFVEDQETTNNTDVEMNPTVERTFEGGTYFFSTAQDPSENTSVYGTSNRFALALLNRSAPTLLPIGGKYANMKELKVEDVLPFAFPFGIGGPKMNRRTKVSLGACIQRYMNLAMAQFLRGDVILVLNHMYGRQLSYKSGVMVCRSNVNGVSLGESLSTLTIADFQESANGRVTKTMETLTRAISTSCRALGHTAEAAKFSRRCNFAMIDFFGLNSLFCTTTPCDECSFRVRLFAKPQEWVS